MQAPPVGQRDWEHPVTKVAFKEQLEGTKSSASSSYCLPKRKTLKMSAMPRNLPHQLSTSLSRFPLCG